MPLLLTAATALELAAAVPHLSPENLEEHKVKDFFLADRRWLACVTGIGPVNAGIALGAALARSSDVRGVVNIGFAGSFDLLRAPLGSTIMVNEEIWPEYGLRDAQGVDAQALGFSLWQPTDAAPVYDRIKLCTDAEALRLPSLRHMPQGSSLTVAGVSNSPQRVTFLQEKYAPLLENMEGFAVALACARHGIPLLELRTVSNVVGSRKAEHRDFPLARAALQKFFLSYVQNTQ